MTGGYVWPIGGVGEHWHVNHNYDEGCSESDWLRFNLELWRHTGNVRYLDAAERLLRNQYLLSQQGNGGFGIRYFTGDAAGPINIIADTTECPWCCSFHAPLGLYCLKSYLATGSSKGVAVNFPLDFTASIEAAGRQWQVVVRANTDDCRGQSFMEVELAPKQGSGDGRTTLWIRMPAGVEGIEKAELAGQAIAPTIENGYLRIDGDFRAGRKVRIVWPMRLALEKRGFQEVDLKSNDVVRLQDVALRAGSRVLLTAPPPSRGRLVLLVITDEHGNVALPFCDAAGHATVALLPQSDVTIDAITAALDWGQSPRFNLLATMRFNHRWLSLSTRWSCRPDKSRRP